MPSQTLNRLRTLEEAMATMAASIARLSDETRDDLRAHKDEMRDDLRAHREEADRDLRAHREQADRDRLAHREDVDRDLRARWEQADRDRLAHREEVDRDLRARWEQADRDRLAHREDVDRDLRAHREQVDRDLRAWREEAARDRRDLNRQLGEIANAQGRLVEDLVAPSIPRVLRRLLDLPPEAAIAPCGPRLRLRHPTDASRTRELDVVAGRDGVALVVEVKSQLAPEGVTRFGASLEDALAFLAPLGIREVMGAVATLHADASIVVHASRLGILVLAVGDEMMEPKNPPGFVPRRVS